MLARMMVGAIRFYQRGISPFTASACRFTPTCSEYARQAITHHGPIRGGWLGLRRILRCHPLGKWGFDPVPDVPRVQSAGTPSGDRNMEAR